MSEMPIPEGPPGRTTIAGHFVAAADTHWGAVAAGVGGIATAFALLVSLYLLGQQLADRRRAQFDRHRDHASNIGFWVTLSAVAAKADEVYGPSTPGVAVMAHLVNTSGRAVTNILVLVGLRADVWRDASKADKVEYQERVAEWRAVAIGPHTADDPKPLKVELPESAARLVDEYQDVAVIGELLFTDASGVGWVKASSGELIERKSAIWTSMIPLSLAARDELRGADRRGGGLRDRLLYWLVNRLAH
jgi:hypothetical protein